MRIHCDVPRLPTPTSTSPGELGRIFVGVLSGTLGCSHTPDGVFIGTRFATLNRGDTIGVSVTSRNYKVSGRSLPRIFSGFCGTGISIHNSKVNLTMAGRVIGLRGNGLRVSDGRNQNALIAVCLPVSDTPAGGRVSVTATNRRRIASRSVGLGNSGSSRRGGSWGFHQESNAREKYCSTQPGKGNGLHTWTKQQGVGQVSRNWTRT